MHQSAAALCQLLRLSTSALWMYHLRVSGLMARRPRKSKGTSGDGCDPKSLRCTGMRSTRRHPSSALSSGGRDQNADELQ